jgi:hypothetical protein
MGLKQVHSKSVLRKASKTKLFSTTLSDTAWRTLNKGKRRHLFVLCPSLTVTDIEER